MLPDIPVIDTKSPACYVPRSSQEAKIHVAVLRAVQSVYRGHGSLASLQAAACWAVCGLTARSHILQAHAVAMEMHLDLHAIAKVHSGDEKVQEACWKALANMLKGYQAHVAISRQIRMDIFLRDLQSSLKKHRNHQGVQEAACWCIANITANSPQGKAIAAGLGLVRDIKLTVQFHKFASRVLQAALPALNNLVNHKANQRMAIHLGLINDLRSVMQSHRRDAELQELACWTLTSLTAQSPEAQSAAAESGLLNDINGAIMCHHSDVGTVFAATWALHNLTGTDTKVQAMALKLDVLQTLCALLQSHGGHAGVVEQACCVVQVMAGYSEESRALAIMSGLPQVITAALAAHPENALVKASGIEALKSMKVPMKKSKPRIPGWKRLKRAISGRNTGDPSAKKPAASGNAPIRPYAPISAAASQDSQPNASPEDRRLPIPKLPLLEHPKTPNDPAALHPPLSPRHLVSWLPRSRQSLSSSQSSPLSSQQSTSSGHTSEVRESMSFLTLDLHMDGLRSSSRLPDKIEEVC